MSRFMSVLLCSLLSLSTIRASSAQEGEVQAHSQGRAEARRQEHATRADRDAKTGDDGIIILGGKDAKVAARDRSKKARNAAPSAE